MEKVKEEMLERLRNVKSMEEYNLEMLGKSDEIEIDDVKYLGEAEINYRENGKRETLKINVYAVIEGKTIKYYCDEMPLAAETKGVGRNKQEIIPSAEYEKIFKQGTPIKDIIENLKQNEIEEQEKPEEQRKIVSLNELEKQKEDDNIKQEKEEKEEQKEQGKQEKEQSYKISNLKGEVDLDQQVNGETLRKILGLEEEYECIAPVPASSVGVKSNSKYCFVAVKDDNTCTVLEDDILVEDRQEGTNPYDKDSKVNRDGSISEESSISGFKIVNRPNLHLSVGFDERSSTRETTITDVSGRNSRENEMSYELEKEGDGWQNSEARNSLRKEEGIGKSDEMKERKEEHEEVGCEEEKIEDIDNDPTNNTHEHFKGDDLVPGKEEVTFEQWAYELGESTKELIARYEREANKIEVPEEIVNEIESDYGRLPERRR